MRRGFIAIFCLTILTAHADASAKAVVIHVLGQGYVRVGNGQSEPISRLVIDLKSLASQKPNPSIQLVRENGTSDRAVADVIAEMARLPGVAKVGFASVAKP